MPSTSQSQPTPPPAASNASFSMTNFKSFLASASLVLLVGCGGGGSETTSTSPTTPTSTNSTSPPHPASIDSGFITSMYGDGNNLGGPINCINEVCTAYSSMGELIGSVSHSLISSYSGYTDNDRINILETNNGITKYNGTDPGDYTVYGAWMKYSIFSVNSSLRTLPVLGNTQVLFGNAFGDSTNSKPFSNLTYNGLMVASPVAGATKGDFLEGIARLNYDYSDSTLDANFTNITNVKTNSSHTINSVSFNDISVGSRGTFISGSAESFIQGGFMGSNHNEVIGVFEKDNIVGAFGAIKE